MPPTQDAVSSSAREIATPHSPIFILDGLDFLLASQPTVSAISLQSFVSGLRARSEALILSANADSPLLQAAIEGGTSTPLEQNHAHFLTSMAHQSQWVFQLRGLDTGIAKDVSGVLRVSRGGDVADVDHASLEARGYDDTAQSLHDGEWLYHLKGDGSIRVWGRGE
jgi:elongator complex protein 6